MAMEKFHFKFKTGVNDEGEAEFTEVVLPRFENIPFGLIRKNRKLPMHEQFFALLEEVADEDTLKLMDDQPQKAMNKFMEAWQKDSGVSMGES